LGKLAADSDSFLRTVTEILETRKLVDPKYFALKDGRILRVISNIVVAPESSGYLGRFWLFEDATEDQKMLRSAELRADHDILTLLYNRQSFDQDLPRLLNQAESEGGNLTLLAFDLDDFMKINDLLGHATGDDILKRIAQKLLILLRHHNGMLYRIGGDEFALLLLNASDEDLEILAENIVSSIHELSFEFNGNTANVSCSVGIARYPDDAISIQTLLQLANQAMYIVKSRGKNNWLRGQNQHKSKLVILFADISNSTVLNESLGNDGALQLISRALNILSLEVAAHQGVMIKTIGDEIMCTFTQVEVATNAACAMQLAIKDQFPGDENTIKVRIGLHYGDVIHEVNDVYGDAVNIAARVTSVTRAGQIMTTQTLVDALPSELAEKARPAMRTALLGKQESFALYQILWEPEDMSST
jgi:diguanylate cyclase (GGDEF)-like protein